MAITAVKIHPAIGIARVGNSPDEFFIGPERPWEVPDPQGGFKDANCRIKRQAARFRIFAYHDDNTVDEITAAEADITWTVHLANKKAISRNSGGSASDLTIDPGERTLDGPNQIKTFDNGQIKFSGQSPITVPLGEVRTDDDGHLLVLGGFGHSDSQPQSSISDFYDNPNWYDDISDGPIKAHIRLHSTNDEFEADGAWVIVAPPKFAPQLTNVITLYDRIFHDVAVTMNWLSPPQTPSYTNDIYPILQRARETRWVREIKDGKHTWVDPVYDEMNAKEIFSWLKAPGGGGIMPMLNEMTLPPWNEFDGRLTQTQYDMMQLWKDGTFTQDWAGVPAPSDQITPEELDRAALENCVGGAFHPGIEAGGLSPNQPVLDPGNYVGGSDPMRFDHNAVSAGDMSQYMALPWQADFNACGTNWWPVPRPNDVIPQGTTGYQAWDRNVGTNLDMVSQWHNLGFVIRQGNEYVEVDRCDMTFITLMTPHLYFQDVPEGPMGMSRKATLAVAFEVKSTGSSVTLEVLPGDRPTHTRLNLFNSSDTVGPTAGNQVETARLWLVYETGPVGEVIVDQLTVSHQASGRSWVVDITASTAARKSAAVALVLDRSGSMKEDRGDGQSKHQSLQEAASIFVTVMLEGDGVGIVRYNQDAQPLQNVTPLGPPGDPFDPGRQNTLGIIHGTDLNPIGETSIGDGIFEGRTLLNNATGTYDVKSLVVLTDGKENRDRWISEVSDQINELTYAVGLGKPQNTNVAVLQTISGNNGGYLLITGPISGDNRFILQKYFLQILAGISNAEIVLDPQGELGRGQTHRIPFKVTDADTGIDVILLTPYPQYIDFRLETPLGNILQPWRAQIEPEISYVLSQGVTYYRLVLPAELIPNRFDHAGTWHAVLSIGRPQVERPYNPDDVSVAHTTGTYLRAYRDPEYLIARATSESHQRTVPYNLLVHSYSNLTMKASASQSGYEPGATVTLNAVLSESGIPVSEGTFVRADITRPDSSQFQVVFDEMQPGQFAGTFITTISGVYQCRVRANGQTRVGYPFQREQTLTPAVWRGGDYDSDPRNSDGNTIIDWLDERDKRLCRLLNCLTSNRSVMTPEFQRRLQAAGLNVDQLIRCLRLYCKTSSHGGNDAGIRAALKQLMSAEIDYETLLSRFEDLDLDD